MHIYIFFYFKKKQFNFFKHSQIEFCVCFIANNIDEHWDSNNGQNFILTTLEFEQSNLLPTFASSTHLVESSSSLLSGSPTMMGDDPYRLEYGNWTNFAIWKNLKNDTPYW